MSNENHDERGRFAGGPGGVAGSVHPHGAAEVKAALAKPSIHEMRAANEHAFRAARFGNKIAGAGEAQNTNASVPYPRVSMTNLSSSARAGMVRASNQMYKDGRLK